MCCLCFSGWHTGFSQQGAQDYREALYLQTDRDLYIVGEQLWLKVYKLDPIDNRPANFSQVVYLELLNQSGYPVYQLKKHVPDKSGSVGIILSDTLSSGNYLLRAYTSWMRNYPTRDFAFRTISVINPFREMESIGVRNSGDPDQGKDISPAKPAINKLIVELTFDSLSYGSRDRVKGTIYVKDPSGKAVNADLSVSISRSGFLKKQRANFHDFAYTSDRVDPSTFTHLPELEGVLLNGSVFNSLSDEPIANEELVLSIVGKAARCQVYKTKENGSFHFNLDNSGVQELVIQPADSAVNDYYVELEPDFHTAYDHPLPGPLSLDTTILDALNQGIINVQVENIYKDFRQAKIDPIPAFSELNFYGDAEYHIQISDYIRLKNIREAIREIVPKVSLRNMDGKSHLQLENGIDEKYFHNRPLVLVDGVPFPDVDQILNISIRELERIEVINLRYFLDGYLFEGIVHFITKEGKMAGLEFDHSIFRQAFVSFSESPHFSSPIYDSKISKNSKLVDLRNTLYWNPDLFTGEDGKASFEFYTSDDTGEYTVVVEGISQDGKSCFVNKKLIVH